MQGRTVSVDWEDQGRGCCKFAAPRRWNGATIQPADGLDATGVPVEVVVVVAATHAFTLLYHIPPRRPRRLVVP